MGEQKRNFFISYNEADAQWATWIAGTLEAEGYTCYVQEWDFPAGGNFVLDMDKALKNSERFIAVLSNDYLESVYCQAEWASAFTKDPNSQRRLLIPVRVANIKPTGLLAAIVCIDLFGKNETEAEQELLRGLDSRDTPRNRPSLPGSARVRFPGTLPFNNLPYVRNVYFTGRDEVLKNICATFDSGEAISLTQSITGLGGLGKTQAALEYAYRYAHKYEWIWWVPAETEATVLDSYRAFAKKMELIGNLQPDDEMIIEAILNWQDQNSQWLFIYDNADNISASTHWWPRNNRGNILITTRNRQSHIGKPLDIAVFSNDEALEFLSTRTGIDNDDADALLLSERLGYLPLALEQAAAYIRNNNCPYAEYLKLLDDYGLEVLEKIDGIINYELPVTATLEISINKINEESSQQLLYLCAYLAPEGIAKKLFEDNMEFLPPALQKGFSNLLKANEIWGKLTQYSLLEKQGEQGYSIHRILQEVVRNKIGDDPQWARCCVELLCNKYKFDYANQAHFLLYLPHIEAFVESSDSILTDEDKEGSAFLCSESGFGNYCLGNYNQALEWYEKALAISEKVLGKEHPNTKVIRGNMMWIEAKLNQGSKREYLTGAE